MKRIQKTVYNLFKKEPFFALLLQEINIRMDRRIPLMGVTFDKKINKFLVFINDINCEKLTDEEFEGCLIHEVLHVLHQHITSRLPDLDKADHHAKTMSNLAMDMAINQYIRVLPKGTVDVADWKEKDGSPFPKYKPYEVYYDLIKQTVSEKCKQQCDGNSGEGDNNDQKGGKNGKQQDGLDGVNDPTYSKYAGQKGETLDQHEFDQMNEDEKKEYMKELKNMLQRTIEKTSYSHSLIPSYLKDLLENLDKQIGYINYKKILLSCIKKSLALLDREHTWFKPNKRFGYVAQGTKLGAIPKGYFFIDSSGSISYTEINEFLLVIDNFLKVGQKKCFLGKWHTELYEVKKYRIGTRLKERDLQSGGTDPIPVLKYIKKANPDISIILTDGYFELPRDKYNNNILWVISKNGNKDKDFLSKLPGKWVFIP